MVVAHMHGDLYAPAQGEAVIFAESFTELGRYQYFIATEPGQLGVVATGVVKRVEGDDTYLETEVYHREVCARCTFNI
jgi:hypothetical protein